MNRLITIICFVFIVAQLTAQQDTIKTESKKDVKKDTTRIMLGKKEIKIIETDEGTEVKINKKEDKENKDEKIQSDDKDKTFDFDFGHRKEHTKRFRGHWDGISFGYNGFMDKDKSMSLNSPENSFMSLNNNPTRSININLNFAEVDQKLIGNSVGLVTGLGIEFNNYFFENNNTIIKDSAGIIVPQYFDPIRLDKSKLTLMYFTIPLILEIQLPSENSKRLWIAAGVTGSIKISSHTKIVYRENGHKQKDKNRDDFNIAALRYGLTGRMGYNNFYVYGNYYPVQFFEKNRGPELYPFSVGVGFHFD